MIEVARVFAVLILLSVALARPAFGQDTDVPVLRDGIDVVSDLDGGEHFLAAVLKQGQVRSFAAGLRRDGEAVMTALSSEWSNGQTEGQINRLKMIKRQMYGRANFDLLRARVLHTAQA
jgi:hypothetical protein